MKQITTIKSQAVISYEAVDGTIFSREETCREYENSARCAIRKMVLDIPHYGDDTFGKIFNYDGDDCIYMVLFPQNKEDIATINKMLCFEHGIDNANNPLLLSADKIGKGVIACINSANDFRVMKRTLKEYISEYQKFVDNQGKPLNS